MGGHVSQLLAKSYEIDEGCQEGSARVAALGPGEGLGD